LKSADLTLLKAEWEESLSLNGEANPSTLEALQKLGNRDAGQLDSASQALERLVALRRSINGDLDYKSLQAITLFASVLFQKGQFSEARSLQEEALVALTEANGSDSDVVDIVARQLEESLIALNDLSALQSLEERIVAARQTRLGHLHIDTLRARSALAKTHRDAGRFDIARIIDSEVMDAALSGGHPEDPRAAIAAGMNLARDLVGLKEVAPLQPLFERLVSLAKQLPRNDPVRKDVERRSRMAKPLMSVMSFADSFLQDPEP
jgi:tetratricopeptide (TPR) repeat protein